MSICLSLINPAYAEMYRLVRKALAKIAIWDEVWELPPAIKEFALTDHELAVLLSLECLLEGKTNNFCSYNLEPVEETACELRPIDEKLFNEYRRKAKTGDNVLRWALLLHDIAKDRGPKGAHPPKCAKMAEKILGLIKFSDCGLRPAEKRLVVWLVAHHDVLGNIFTAERFPGHLLQITRGVKDFDRRMSLLQVVMLCDLRGTLGGRFLTCDKAEFWRNLSDKKAVEKLRDEWFDYLIKRWTGHVSGAFNPKKENELKKLLADPSAFVAPVKPVFQKQISLVVDGFYLITALNAKQQATLIKELTEKIYRSKLKNQKEITLVFDTKYKPPPPGETSAALAHYTEQLDRGDLAIKVKGNQVHCV